MRSALALMRFAFSSGRNSFTLMVKGNGKNLKVQRETPLLEDPQLPFVHLLSFREKDLEARPSRRQ